MTCYFQLWIPAADPHCLRSKSEAHSQGQMDVCGGIVARLAFLQEALILLKARQPKFALPAMPTAFLHSVLPDGALCVFSLSSPQRRRSRCRGHSGGIPASSWSLLSAGCDVLCLAGSCSFYMPSLRILTESASSISWSSVHVDLEAKGAGLHHNLQCLPTWQEHRSKQARLHDWSLLLFVLTRLTLLF